MSLAQDILRKIKTKEAELRRLQQEMKELEMQMAQGHAYIQGLREILPKAERREQARGGEGENISPNGATSEFREGSGPQMAKMALEASEKPLHLSEILEKIGQENTKKNRLSLGSTLSRYARNEHIFIKAGPNIFGLKGKHKPVNVDDLLQDFGT